MITRSRIQLQSQNFQILFPVTSNTYNHIFMTKKVIEKITNINKIWSIYQLIIFHKKSQNLGVCFISELFSIVSKSRIPKAQWPLNPQSQYHLRSYISRSSCSHILHLSHTLFTNLVFQKYHVYKSCNSRSYSNILCLNNIFFTNPLLEEHLVLDPKNILFTNPMFHKHIIRRSYAQRTPHKKPPLQQWGSTKLL